jgi:hypothetical protein
MKSGTTTELIGATTVETTEMIGGTVFRKTEITGRIIEKNVAMCVNGSKLRIHERSPMLVDGRFLNWDIPAPR